MTEGETEYMNQTVKERCPRAGLVMEGGAMRGMFTCGVIDIFMENDITFDSAIGVSAGAVFGCNLKSRQIGRAIRYNKRFCRNKNYESIQSLLKTGDLYNADFCYRLLPMSSIPGTVKPLPPIRWIFPSYVQTWKPESRSITFAPPASATT